MTVHAQKRRTPREAKAAKGIIVKAKAPTVASVRTDSRFVKIFDQVWALVLSMVEQNQELSLLKEGLGTTGPRSVEAFLQVQRQAFLKYDFLELVGEAWELKRVIIIRNNTIASLRGSDPVGNDIDRIKASLSPKERVEAFFGERRLTPRNDALDEIPVYVVHSLAERLWRKSNGNIPVSTAASIAWLVLPENERRQWLGRAAIATMEAAPGDPASVLGFVDGYRSSHVRRTLSRSARRVDTEQHNA
jgi:hypothetical protein